MRVLLTSQPGLGHLNGLAALGRELRFQGHEVLAAGAPSVVAAFEQAGVAGLGIVSEPLGSDTVEIHAQLPELLALDPPDRLALLHVELGVRRRASAMVKALPAVIDSWKPNLLLRDATEFGAWVIAERYHLPHISLEVSAHWPEDLWNSRTGKAFCELRALAGIELDPSNPADGFYRYLHLNNAPAALRAPEVPLPLTSYDMAPEFFDSYGPAHELVAPPGHLYVAFGSIYRPPAGAVRELLEVLAKEFPFVVVATNESAPQANNVFARPYVSQSALMPATGAVLCHGGRNTVLTAMRHGVPVICAPMGSDQFAMANFVQQAGAGETVRWELESLVAATRRVVNEPSYRRNSQQIAAQIAAMPSVAETVEMLGSRFGS